ncbi:unnamed protein product, partial [Allacma fusca]
MGGKKTCYPFLSNYENSCQLQRFNCRKFA